MNMTHCRSYASCNNLQCELQSFHSKMCRMLKCNNIKSKVKGPDSENPDAYVVVEVPCCSTISQQVGNQ